MQQLEAIREIMELVSYHPESGSSLILYNLLQDENLTQEEAIKHFPSSNHYRTACLRLREKYLDELLKSNFHKSRKYVREYSKLIKQHAQFKLLFKQQKTKAGEVVGKSLIRKAKRYDLLEIMLDVSSTLSSYYAGAKRSPEKSKEFSASALEAYENIGEELRAQRLLNSISINKTADYIAKAELDELGKLENNHYRFNLYYYSAHLLYRRYKKDKEGIVNVCEKAVDCWDNSPHVIPSIAYMPFTFEVVPQLIRRKSYGKAERIINKCLKSPEPGSYNYHVLLLLKGILGIASAKPGIVKASLHEAGKKWLFDSPDMVGAWQDVQEEFREDSGLDGAERLLGRLYG